MYQVRKRSGAAFVSQEIQGMRRNFIYYPSGLCYIVPDGWYSDGNYTWQNCIHARMTQIRKGITILITLFLPVIRIFICLRNGWAVSCSLAYAMRILHAIERKKRMKKPVTREEKDIQIRREAKATFILFGICCVWNILFAYLIPGSIRIGGLPLWWLVSTPGMFVLAVVGVVFILKRVFVNFSLEDEEEGGRENA